MVKPPESHNGPVKVIYSNRPTSIHLQYQERDRPHARFSNAASRRCSHILKPRYGRGSLHYIPGMVSDSGSCSRDSWCSAIPFDLPSERGVSANLNSINPPEIWSPRSRESVDPPLAPGIHSRRHLERPCRRDQRATTTSRWIAFPRKPSRHR